MHGPIMGPNGEPMFPHLMSPQNRPPQPFMSVGKAFKPVHDLLLVRRLNSIDTSLEIPESIKDREQHALVIDVGPGGYTQGGSLIPLCASIGDVVFLPVDDGQGKPLGIKVKVGDDELTLIRNHQILGVFPKGATEINAIEA
jgi:co-chaperonin GroES (HSP10)